MAGLQNADHRKLVAAKKVLIAAQGEFDAAMSACRSSPTAEKRAKVQAAKNRIDDATRYIEQLDRLFNRQIRQEERAMASQNGTHITKSEQEVLNQQENAVSKNIGS
jgi:hypothetical protein